MLRAGGLGVVAVAMALGAPGASAAGRCGNHPWCNQSLSPAQRASLLEKALTNEEKIDLLAGDDLFGVSGGAHTHTGTSDGVPRVGLPNTYYSDGPVGPRQLESFLLIVGKKIIPQNALSHLAHQAMIESHVVNA